jgi:hypothetical protein
MVSYREKIGEALEKLDTSSDFDAKVKQMKVLRFETIAWAKVLSSLLDHFSTQLKNAAPKNSIYLPRSSPEYLAAVSAGQSKFQMYLRIKCLIRRQFMIAKRALPCI